jgi:hypothetical protein
LPEVAAAVGDRAAVDCGVRGGRGAVQLGLALLRDAQLQGLGRRLDVPVAERLGQQPVDRRAGFVAGDVAGVRAGTVVGHDLQMRPRLEGHRADLGPGHRRSPATPPAGRHRPPQSGVEQQVAHVGEGGVQGLGHPSIVPRPRSVSRGVYGWVA